MKVKEILQQINEQPVAPAQPQVPPPAAPVPAAVPPVPPAPKKEVEPKEEKEASFTPEQEKRLKEIIKKMMDDYMKAQVTAEA